MNLLLIRRDATDGIEVKQAIQQMGLSVCDVHRHEQISITELNSLGTTDIRFFNRPISRFERIFFLHTPAVPIPGNAASGSKSHTFDYCEMDASVVSALQNYPGKLINVGLLNMSLSIKNRYFLVFLFRSLGWPLHPSLFNLKQILPDKTLYQFQLLITHSSYTFYPGNDAFSQIFNEAAELIFRTQKAMWDRQLDILQVSCTVVNNTLTLVGVSENFQHISPGVLAGALKEVI